MGVHIRARGVSLDVPHYQQPERGSKGWGGLFLGAVFDPPRRELVRLLDGVDFELNEGDRLAILGRNGAGKSTLLRVLNRVYQPTRGSLEVEGTCQALLNMGLGFNSEATVLENIFLRGVAMGLKGPFLRANVREILEFSGLVDKAGHRLRTLSSGQRMRLGFAISTSVQHDIILMDEWVGAGDAEFMAKAKERMQSRVGGSKIVVLASHSTGLLRDICNKGIVLEKGRVIEFGDITSALKAYHELLAGLRNLPAEPAGRESGAQVFGCLEQIVELGGGRLSLKGWLVNTEGQSPDGLVLEINGIRITAGNLRRTRRTDVARHLGLATDYCGFQAEVILDEVCSVADLESGVSAYGGVTAESANAPLRLARNLLSRLGDNATS